VLGFVVLFLWFFLSWLLFFVCFSCVFLCVKRGHSHHFGFLTFAAIHAPIIVFEVNAEIRRARPNDALRQHVYKLAQSCNALCLGDPRQNCVFFGTTDADRDNLYIDLFFEEMGDAFEFRHALLQLRNPAPEFDGLCEILVDSMPEEVALSSSGNALEAVLAKHFVP
jgi:hypothetical protein